MYLIGHAAVGMILASGTENPAAAFGIGWLSHYLADFVPHGDEAVGAWAKRGNEVKRLFALFVADGALFLAAFTWLSAARGFSLPLAAAAVGSFVPDVLWGLEKLAGRRLFGIHERFHNRNHNFFRVHVPLWLGLVLQAAATGGLWWHLSRWAA